MSKIVDKLDYNLVFLGLGHVVDLNQFCLLNGPHGRREIRGKAIAKIINTMLDMAKIGTSIRSVLDRFSGRSRNAAEMLLEALIDVGLIVAVDSSEMLDLASKDYQPLKNFLYQVTDKPRSAYRLLNSSVVQIYTGGSINAELAQVFQGYAIKLSSTIDRTSDIFNKIYQISFQNFSGINQTVYASFCVAAGLVMAVVTEDVHQAERVILSQSKSDDIMRSPAAEKLSILSVAHYLSCLIIDYLPVQDRGFIVNMSDLTVKNCSLPLYISESLPWVDLDWSDSYSSWTTRPSLPVDLLEYSSVGTIESIERSRVWWTSDIFAPNVIVDDLAILYPIFSVIRTQETSDRGNVTLTGVGCTDREARLQIFLAGMEDRILDVAKKQDKSGSAVLGVGWTAYEATSRVMGKLELEEHGGKIGTPVIIKDTVCIDILQPGKNDNVVIHRLCSDWFIAELDEFSCIGGSPEEAEDNVRLRKIIAKNSIHCTPYLWFGRGKPQFNSLTKSCERMGIRLKKLPLGGPDHHPIYVAYSI